jgi:hypothetical protein
MEVAILGIDLGKNVCSLIGFDGGGKVTLRRRMKREGLPAFADRLAPCIVAMEACCGVHHLGRIFAARLKAQKNDDRDAEAVAEAATRPTKRFVALKSEEQLDADAAPRPRSVGGRADGADQPVEGNLDGARDCGAARTQTRAGTRRLDRRETGPRFEPASRETDRGHASPME